METMMPKDRMVVDWPVFLEPHDMRFDTLPQRWQESPCFGNAMVGSMLYQVGNTLQLQLFRSDVRDHRDDRHGWTAYSRPRFLVGHFALQPVGTLTGCNWRLDLWNAELTGTVTTDRGEILLRHLVHAEDMAIVTELHPSAGEAGCTWSWHPAEAATTRGGYPVNAEEAVAFAERYGEQYLQTLEPPMPNPPGRLEREGRVAVWIQDLLVGGQYAIAWGERDTEGVRTHIATVAKSHPESRAAQVAVADMERFLAAEPAAWLATHRAWWQAYYPRSFVTIPDKALESLYWQTVYRLGCTARAGRFHIDTSGLWFQGGPWPYTTNDWNTQSALWGVYAANRLEQGEELVNRLSANRNNMVLAVDPAAWQDDSAYLHLATADDMAGHRSSDRRYVELVGCLPWVLHNAWWQYRFSMDDEMLRQTIYPLLRRAVNLYLHLVHEGSDGRLHLPPTYSPETGIWADCNFDLALFKWGCHGLLKACQRLGIEDALIPRWREVIAKLVDFPIDEHGFMLGADETSREQHRHFSNLLMIYPLYLVNVDQKGAENVLLLSAARAHGTDGLPAMVQTHAGPISCAVGLGDQALEGLKRLQADLHPNGLWSCAGNPCIESSLSVLNNLQEMLIQSWSDPALDQPGTIRVFPALPSVWQDAEFHDLRAEGAFLVSARRHGGRTEWVRIHSLAGEPCHVRPGIEGRLSLEAERVPTLREVSHGVYSIDLQKGETVVLRRGVDAGRNIMYANHAIIV